MSGSRGCRACEIRWPYTTRFMVCPICLRRTEWGNTPARYTPEAEQRAEQAMAAAAEFYRDMARAESLSLRSGGLLTVADIVTAQYHGVGG